MPGQADFSALQLLGDVTSTSPVGTVTNRFLALFTAAPLNDAGTGGTEVSGGAYARTQIASVVIANGAFTTASTTITLSATVPAWVSAAGSSPGLGVNVFDNSITGGGAQIGTVASVSGSVLTLQAASLRNSQGAADNIQLSVFPVATASVGAEPTTVAPITTNTAQINMIQSTGSWGSVLAWGIYDAPTAGNCRFWDYLGNFPWLPAYSGVASPGVITSPRHGLTAATPFAVSAKAGGNFPTFSQSSFTNNTGTLLVTAPGTDFFTSTNGGTAVNTATTGDFMVRGLTLQAIPTATTPQFAAGAFAISAA